MCKERVSGKRVYGRITARDCIGSWHKHQYRLKTVRNADQILVVDDGRFVQKGKHEELIGQKGIYADFVPGRKEAIGWKLEA